MLESHNHAIAGAKPLIPPKVGFGASANPSGMMRYDASPGSLGKISEHEECSLQGVTSICNSYITGTVVQLPVFGEMCKFRGSCPIIKE